MREWKKDNRVAISIEQGERITVNERAYKHTHTHTHTSINVPAFTQGTKQPRTSGKQGKRHTTTHTHQQSNTHNCEL